MNKRGVNYYLVLFVAVFLFGWIAHDIYLGVSDERFPFSDLSKDKSSPGNWIKDEQIHVDDNGIFIDIKNAKWASFANTDSMDPLIDAGTNSIEIVPENEDELEIGDIISYKANFINKIVMHRIIEIGEDEQGKYFILKGDNNDKIDPENVRFEQIKGVLVGILY